MALWSDAAILLAYIFQQVGVMLGVGAESVLLVLYLAHINKPEHPAHMRARSAQYIGLALIVLSGVGAVALEWESSQTATLLAPAFIFKWILVLLLIPAAWFEVEKAAAGWGRHIVRGIAGALWYAMFIVHAVAPDTTWPLLLAAFAAWTALFMMLWMACVFILHRASTPKKILKPEAEQKLRTVPQPIIASAMPVAPRPVAQPILRPSPAVVRHDPAPAPTKPQALPVVAHIELDAPHKMPAPAPIHHEPAQVPLRSHTPDAAPERAHTPDTAPFAPKLVREYEIPTVRVMPRSPEDLKTATI